MEYGLMDYSWVVTDLDGCDLILEFSDDITKDELMFVIGKYETEDINEHKFKVKTDFPFKKLEKFQKKITDAIQQELFVLT
jgi:23S rRNA U2552 (ribose-2'-O)-methylase RlmE/FtsJ